MPSSRLKTLSRTCRIVSFAAVAGLLLAGCATVPTDPAAHAEYKQLNDPLEPTNRAIFAVNEALDKVLIRPLAEVYHFILPNFVEERITVFLRNVGEPLTLVNDVLQGEVDRAGVTFGRFVTNSTVGIGGIFDVATDLDLPRHNEDFGQTFGAWGIGEGPYLVLPLLGSSTLRDGVGTVADTFADPVTIGLDQANVSGLALGRIAITGLDARARNLEMVDQLRRESLDYYATLRSAYRQNRRSEVLNGAAPDEGENGVPGFEEYEDLDAPAQTDPESPAPAPLSPTGR
ncbi:VacJ family lipoprotein [Emcibacter sp. SYSU 3D8]|uniref:MlaA family lipoprotein n=1 Tax=Emcibacter sp. SYSU 3D8 TaxID=3133969 RepID=UPI0031FF0CA0